MGWDLYWFGLFSGFRCADSLLVLLKLVIPKWIIVETRVLWSVWMLVLFEIETLGGKEVGSVALLRAIVAHELIRRRTVHEKGGEA